MKRKTRIPAEWDAVLSVAIFAYSTAPHEATRESPFYSLHAFDHHYPSNEIPVFLNWNHVDYDDYKYELSNEIQLAHESAIELSTKNKKRRKIVMEAKKVSSKKLPK